MKSSFYLILYLLMIPAVTCAQMTYTTDFDSTENPISENGKWKSGRCTGLDWTDVKIINGMACGTQSGIDSGIKMYNDSYAFLKGFPADQTVQGIVTFKNPSVSCNQEVELLLRWNSEAHRATGYECLVRCMDSEKSYMEIVRWNGPLGDFTYITRLNGTAAGIKDGDTLKATIAGSKIRVYVNNEEIIQGNDSTWTIGNPGIGFFLSGCSGTNTSFGFKSFTAKGL